MKPRGRVRVVRVERQNESVLRLRFVDAPFLRDDHAGLSAEVVQENAVRLRPSGVRLLECLEVLRDERREAVRLEERDLPGTATAGKNPVVEDADEIAHEGQFDDRELQAFPPRRMILEPGVTAPPRVEPTLRRVIPLALRVEAEVSAVADDVGAKGLRDPVRKRIVPQKVAGEVRPL